jgi:IclR family KDG regulon transcriptional repressor
VETDVRELETPARPGESLVTLRRGLLILETLGSQTSPDGLSETDIAEVLGIKQSTLYRYLACLIERGLVEPVSHRRYRIGWRAGLLTTGVRGRAFGDFAPQVIAELAATTGETAHACLYDPPESVTISIAEGDGPVGPRILVGARRPVHCCASGKLFLAYDTTGRTETYLRSRLESRTAATLVDSEVLFRALENVRRAGFATDQQESYEGICGLAVPVRAASGAVAGALSITVVTTHLDERWTQALAEPLVENAQRLSLNLGFVGVDEGVNA